MRIRVCVAGATGWAGGPVTRHILKAQGFQLVGAVARRDAGRDIGEALGLPEAGITIAPDLDEALAAPADVLIDYTTPATVKARTLRALDRGLRVVIGTSGLAAAEFEEIEQKAVACGLGVIAAGNFSVSAALAKHFALIAARYMPSWEIVDYAQADKVDAPSGTAQELAEALGQIAPSQLAMPIEKTHGRPDARGAGVAGTQVHAVRLPGYVLSFEALFGLPDERLSIRHDAGSGAEPYVGGTILAAQRVMTMTGLVRGLDTLLFGQP
jgi:4-hydroxy-tetrahydrodipicolinate reductase